MGRVGQRASPNSTRRVLSGRPGRGDTNRLLVGADRFLRRSWMRRRIPLLRNSWLAKKGKRYIALEQRLNHSSKTIAYEIRHDAASSSTAGGTVRLGSATCPFCGYSTPVESVRTQICRNKGGAAESQLICVVTTKHGVGGRIYRRCTSLDLVAIEGAINTCDLLFKAMRESFLSCRMSRPRRMAPEARAAVTEPGNTASHHSVNSSRKDNFCRWSRTLNWFVTPTD